MMRTIVAALFIATALMALPAAADTPNMGITLNVASGVHEEPSGVAKVPVVPAPLIDLRLPLNRFELRAETTPPLGPIGYGTSSARLRTTRIAYAAGMGYIAVSPRTRIGAGETLLNQISHYAYSDSSSRENVDDASRVAGLRLGLEQTLYHVGNTSLIALVEGSPAMHAALHQDGTITLGGAYVIPVSHTAPETASLIDTQLRAERRHGALTWTYGLRYVNYAARFDETGESADRNRLLMAFTGLRWALGH